MKKTLLKLFIFLLLFCLIDFLTGKFFFYMQSHSLSYLPGYIAHHAKEDVIIFGSSKGGSNYNMALLNDSLEKTCLNCADTGNGIIQMYGRFKMLVARYKPQIIIYDVKPEFDLQKNDNTKYTMRLKPFYKEAGIDSIILSTSTNEQYKLYSSLYRYNFQFMEILKEYASHSRFSPSYENLSRKKMKIIPKAAEPKCEEFDSLKIHYLEELIKDSQQCGINLVFVVSPEYFYYKSTNYDPLTSLCKRYKVPFIDMSADKQFVGHDDLFIDSLHMNYWGATKWSLFLIHYIKNHFI